MKNNEILVTVSGGAGSGKSTIAAQISNLLIMSGFRVEYKDDDEPHLSIQEIATRYINLVTNNTKIKIQTQQLAREEIKKPIVIDTKIEEELFQKLKNIVCEQLGVNPGIVTRESDYVVDLGADSLDTVELLMVLEEEFGLCVEDGDAEKMKTISDTINYLINKGVVQ